MKAAILLLVCIGAAAAATPPPAAGGKLFAVKCAICHDVDGGQRRVGPGLKGVKDGKLPSGRNATPETVLKRLNDGGGGMPVFRELLTEEEKQSLVAYVMTL